MARQLNIRSDEAYETARRIARRLGTSTTEAVVRALHCYDRETSGPIGYEALSEEERDFVDEMRGLSERIRAEVGPDATSDHDDLYDDIGAPK